MSARKVAALGLAAVAVAVPTAGHPLDSAVAGPDRTAVASLPTVRIDVTASGATISGARHFRAGRVAIVMHTATSTGSDGGFFSLAHFTRGYSPAKYMRDFGYYYSHGGGDYRPTSRALQALRRADHHTHTFGGLAFGSGQTHTETVVLPAGSYYVTADDQHFTKFVAHGATSSRPGPQRTATVTAYGHNHFGGATVLPRRGTITFANDAKSADHALEFRQIKRDTSRRTVANRYAHLSNERSSKTPSWFLKGNYLTLQLQHGRSQTLSYSLPAGKYLELGYVTDPRTGNEQAYEGMWRIVTLR